MERTKRVKMFQAWLRFRPRFCRRQSTDYQQFGDRETLTISMWSTDSVGAGADGTGGGTGGKNGPLTQMERCIQVMDRKLQDTKLQMHYLPCGVSRWALL